MKSQKEFLSKIVKLLEASGIDYMIAGSVASSLHGRPRATQDIDIIVKTTQMQLSDFVQSLGKDFYVSSQAAREAFKNQTMFNIIDTIDGHKADIIILKNRPFSIEEFRRRKKVRLMGAALKVVSPEDVILSKLEWSKAAGSERQFDDALGVAIVQWNNIDFEYLRKWSGKLHIEGLLERLLDEAKKFQAG